MSLCAGGASSFAHHPGLRRLPGSTIRVSELGLVTGSAGLPVRHVPVERAKAPAAIGRKSLRGAVSFEGGEPLRLGSAANPERQIAARV